MSSLIGFIIALLIVVCVHEWGHFYAARRLGMPVVRFSIGIGQAIWSTQRGGTEFRLGWLPLGGYVMFADAKEHDVPPVLIPHTFSQQSLFARAWVVVAGPLVNIILAWVLMTVVLMVGLSSPKAWLAPGKVGTPWAEVSGDEVWQVVSVNGHAIDRFEQLPVQLLRLVDEPSLQFSLESWSGAQKTVSVSSDQWRQTAWVDPKQQLQQWGIVPTMPPIPAKIGQIASDSVAAQSGLALGDVIVQLNGMQVDRFSDLADWVRQHPGQKVELTVDRAGQQVRIAITLGSRQQAGQAVGYLGIAPAMPEGWQSRWFTDAGMSLDQAMQAALPKLWDITVLTWQAIGRLVTGRSGLEQLSGPIGIAQAAGDSIDMGWLRFLQFLALLSLSLGVLNLLPLPLLDGGHLLLYALEALRGKALSAASMLIWQKIGIVLIAGLTLLAIGSDFKRLLGG